MKIHNICQRNSMKPPPLLFFTQLFPRDYYDSAQSDQGFITFDLEADLAPLFNWNVKVI